jgi:lipopolysaccharide/colanic/teichoic acid biosynthesis glycosyltransferase
MEWTVIVALVVVIPIILLPVAYLSYLNIGGIYKAIRVARQKKVAHVEATEIVKGG